MFYTKYHYRTKTFYFSRQNLRAASYIYGWGRHIMRLIVLAGLALTMLPTAQAMVEDRFKVSVAPGVWYVKWQPGFNATDNTVSVRYPSYNVTPSSLYGISVSMLYGGYGIAGSYLMSKSEKAILARAGKRTSSLSRDLRLEVLCHLSDTWYLKNSVSSGRFSGTAVGLEWRRGGAPGAAKSLPVDTNWFQGDIGVIFVDPEIKKATGAGAMLGFRYIRYNLPTQVETFDSRGLAKVSFLDTNFSTLMLTYGAEALPGIRRGWQFAIPRLSMGYGITKVTNSAMSEKSYFKQDGDKLYGFMFELDTAVVRSSDHIDFELGVRYRNSDIIAGKCDYNDKKHEYNAGSRLKMSEMYYGPYTRIVFHF